MEHLINPIESVTQVEAARQVAGVHTFLVERARAAISQLVDERPGWGSFAKRACVNLDGPDRPPLVAKSKERIIEVINMAATLERLIDALCWFDDQTEMREWLVLECHPSTSSSAAGNDLVLGTQPDAVRAVCEVTDVVSSSAGQNQKEHSDLKRLGCDREVPTDGVRRFICTSGEFGRALSGKGRRWATRKYSYRLHEIGETETMLLEVLPPALER